ncbi:hypothetical protein [Pasteuria penetrans]|uniref:hypothetical protein n=1 Tax=Pasteuria penetrans TaxID=86005 RepID=UPI000FAFC462|nr:hypothetical protein [Pasteuria penetrans]
MKLFGQNRELVKTVACVMLSSAVLASSFGPVSAQENAGRLEETPSIPKSIAVEKDILPVENVSLPTAKQMSTDTLSEIPSIPNSVITKGNTPPVEDVSLPTVVDKDEVLESLERSKRCWHICWGKKGNQTCICMGSNHDHNLGR